MNSIIEVKNLSKQYRINRYEGQMTYGTLRDDLTKIFKTPFNLLTDSRENIWALEKVNFSVKPGEMVGIIGPNGAGKTTLLKVLSRITPPTKGGATVRGRTGSLLEVGIGFHPELTGRENIYLNGAILGMKKKEIERKFDEIVEFAGIRKFLDTPLKRYSSGMYVRLAFSVVAHLEPDILLVDEVLAVGDLEFQKKCLGKMKEMIHSNRTVLFVSHNMATVANLCPRTILLDSGKIVMDGPSPEVLKYYRDSRESNVFKVVWRDPVRAPGNEEVKLHKVRVLSEGGEPVSKVDIQKDILIELTYWNFKEGAKLLSSIHLVNNQGLTLLVTFNGPSANLVSDSWYDKPRPKGLFRSICRIPGNFLEEGFYSVNVFIVSHSITRIKHVAQERVVFFHVVDNEATGEAYRGLGGRGAIRHRLAWRTEYKGNNGDYLWKKKN